MRILLSETLRGDNMSDYTTVSANGLPAVNELIKFAVRDINDALEKQMLYSA